MKKQTKAVTIPHITFDDKENFNTNPGTPTKYILTAENVNEIKSKINSLIDNNADVYTKNESDSKYAQKSDVYTKSVTDSKYAIEAETNVFTNTNTFSGNVVFNNPSSNCIEVKNGNNVYLRWDNVNKTLSCPASFMTINDIKTPTNGNQAVNKSYVDGYSYSKNESDSRYVQKAQGSLDKTLLNMLFPVGSIVMTCDNSVHALVTQFPGKLQELTDSDIAYLAIGTNSSNSNTGSFTIQQRNLPNINWSWYVDWANGITSNETNLQAYKNGGSANMDITGSYAATNVKNSVEASQRGARVSVFTRIYLNGNVNQSPITYTMKPKTLKVRAWKVISTIWT